MKRSRGFTLAVVFVASTILFIVLALALQITSSSSRALRDQVYNQLAREAAEAGGVYITECIQKGTFDTSATVRPNTKCSGAVVDLGDASEYIISTPRYRTTYEAKYIEEGVVRTSKTIGKVELLRASDGTVYKTYTYNSNQQVNQEETAETRASKRWWYFGENAIIDFGVSGTGATGKRTSGDQPRMGEGVTTVSNRQGGLMFYTNGRDVWNRNGDLMPVRTSSTNYNKNCDLPAGEFVFSSLGQGLCGSHTATQAVASFPINSAENKYIIVTNTANNNGYSYGTLYWSLVDFSSSSYPNGRITTRNASVAPPDTNGVRPTHYASEALNARPNAMGNGAVIYTYRPNNPNAVYAFGIWTLDNGSHIISGQHPTMSDNTKPIQRAYFEFNDSNGKARICGTTAQRNTHTGYGTINFNRDYTRMVIDMGGGFACSASKRAGTIQIFDISGGDTSLDQLNYWEVVSGSENRGYGYSADFSPNGRYVYTSSIAPGKLFRYDLISGDNTTIKQSERFIGDTNCASYSGSGPDGNSCLIAGGRGGGQVLRGPNDKMYVADQSASWVSVVHKPNAPNADTSEGTATNVVWNYGKFNGGLKLPSGALSLYGLPQMVTLFSPRASSY